MHGYDLMGELTARMGRSYRASPGSIYPAIQALEDEGLIAGREEDDRRVYELSKAGVAALSARVDKLSALEARLGVRFASGIDAALGRFIECVRAASERADQQDIEAVLDRATEELRVIGGRK